ncbi:MAG: hypothetical protein K2X66_00765 [Cyanobacteria bacterium]|nr:hypothetical protein [Cyanobacteriota bacterium]
MQRKGTKEVSEKDTLKKRQAALQTKGQKRWRVKGSNINALLNEYSNAADHEFSEYNEFDEDDLDE